MNTYQQLWQSLTPLYDADEARAIVRTVLEVKYGMTLTDIICGKITELSADESIKLEEIMKVSCRAGSSYPTSRDCRTLQVDSRHTKGEGGCKRKASCSSPQHLRHLHRLRLHCHHTKSRHSTIDGNRNRHLGESHCHSYRKRQEVEFQHKNKAC